MAPSLYKIEIEILNFLQLLSLSNQKPVDTRLGPKTYYKPQKETKDKSIIAVKLISISDSVSREIKYFSTVSVYDSFQSHGSAWSDEYQGFGTSYHWNTVSTRKGWIYEFSL